MTAALAFLAILAAPAEARIFQVIPADESETPTFDFTDDQALFAIGTSDFLGGQVCIVDDLTEDPGDGSLSCDDAAWGSPNQVIGLGTFIIPIESPTLKIGRYKLLGDGGVLPGHDALSLPFTIHPCTVCDPRIGILAIAAYKDTARAMGPPIDDLCTWFNYMDLVGDVARGLRSGAALAGDLIDSTPRFGALVGVPIGGAFGFALHTINNNILEIPFSRLQAYLLLMRTVTCRTRDMYRDIAADPPDPNYGSVASPQFGFLPSVENELVDDLAESVDRQRAFGAAQLTAFERYQAADADGNDAAVRLQSQAIADFGYPLRDEMRRSADLLRQWSGELALDPGINTATIDANDPDIDAIAAAEARLRIFGFTAGEIAELQAGGLTAEEITDLRAELERADVTTAPTGVTVMSLLDAAADVLDQQSLEIERFAREAEAVAARIGAPPTNNPPVAVDDMLTTQQDTAGSVNVLVNDSDPDPGDTLSVTGSTDGAHGTVSCQGAGDCTYTPAPGYTGPDSFTYTISDGHGGSASATVFVDVFEPASPVALVSISTDFNNPIGIDYHQPTNKVAVSVNYSSGLPLNFELIAEDGSHAPFSSISGFTDEVKIATVRGSSCQGGFQVGELFTGTGVPGVIARIAPDGLSVANPWVTLPDEFGLMRGSLFQDRYCSFGGDLIAVTTAGGVWRVTSAGEATRIAQINTHLEGLTTVPDDPARYGPWAGKLLAGAEGQSRVYAIAADGTVTPYELGIAPEDIDIVPAKENFFGVDFAAAEIKGAPASEFADKVGDVVIAQEFPGILWDVRWNAASQAFQVSEIARVGQWEHVTFAPAGINPLPPTNSAPVASDGTVTTQQGVPVGITLQASDPDGDPLTFTVLSPPSHGTLTGSGAVRTYTPDPTYTGPDSFTFRANDGNLDSNVATVSITVEAVRKSTSTSYTGSGSVQYSDAVTLSGRLLDTSVSPSVPIAGKQLDFTLGTQTASAGPTDPAGAASTSLVVTQQPSSVPSVETSFAGDSSYLPSSDSDPFAILKEDCTLGYTGDTLVAPLALTTLAADIGEPDASLGDRAAKTVVFTVVGVTDPTPQVFTTVTGASGGAAISVALAADVYAVTASFAGDDFYNACRTPTDTLLTVQAAAAKVTGGGWISIGTGRTSFGFNAIPQAGGGWKGQFQLRSHEGKNRFHGNVVLALTSSGNTASWNGTGSWNGEPGYRYAITVVDNGSSGSRKRDTVSIAITSPTGSTVFTTGGSQALKGGNITVHR